MATQMIPKKKSVKLTSDEVKALKSFRKNFLTDVDCAEAIGIGRETFIRVNILGKSSPETIEKIRATITTDAQEMKSSA